MKIKELLLGLDYRSASLDYEDVDIKDIAYNSTEAGESSIFVALVGKTLDGHKYIEDAHNRGCRVFLLSDRNIKEYRDSIYIYVDNTRKALSKISANFFNHPSKNLKVIGITGTKGKTTTSNYLRQVLEDGGHSTGVIGTNGVYYNDRQEKTENTTPESYEIQRILGDMLDAGVEYVVMEVSSGGLMMDRVEDIEFDIGVFTNISEDHIGPKEHPSFEHYLQSKARLFKMCKHGIINLDDNYAEDIIRAASCEFTSYAIENKKADILASNINLSKDVDHLGVSFDLKVKGELEKDYLISSPGNFSVYNALAVISIARQLGVDHKLVKESLKTVSVEGRVELLGVLEHASVILDYAHNKTSLENVLDTLREYNPRKLYCLIGSVGGRSIGRRSEIGQVISQKADVAILTSDNPDYEDPLEIIEGIREGFVDDDLELHVEEDRKKAIALAIDLLEDGDILLLAGKGHEDYQLICGKKIPHSDREIALAKSSQR